MAGVSHQPGVVASLKLLQGNSAGGPVTCLSFSTDRQHVIVGGRDGKPHSDALLQHDVLSGVFGWLCTWRFDAARVLVLLLVLLLVLRVVRVSEDSLKEERNLRGKKKGLVFSSRDIKWHPQHCTLVPMRSAGVNAYGVLGRQHTSIRLPVVPPTALWSSGTLSSSVQSKVC